MLIGYWILIIVNNFYLIYLLFLIYYLYLVGSLFILSHIQIIILNHFVIRLLCYGNFYKNLNYNYQKDFFLKSLKNQKKKTFFDFFYFLLY